MGGGGGENVDECARGSEHKLNEEDYINSTDMFVGVVDTQQRDSITLLRRSVIGSRLDWLVII